MNKISLALAVTMTFSLPSCSDFLDKEPLSQGTEAITFKTPEQFEQAANALYVLPGWNNYKDRLDGGTDLSGLGSNGGGSAPDSDGSWGFGDIRTCCILLEKAEQFGDQKAIAHSVGTAYFSVHGITLTY